MNFDSKIQFYNALIQWCENIQQELSMSSTKNSAGGQVSACDNNWLYVLMSTKHMSELYKEVYTVILEMRLNQRKIQFRKYHFLKCGWNKLINVVIENSIWFTMIRSRFRFRINPFKSSKKSQNRNFLSKIEKQNQLGTNLHLLMTKIWQQYTSPIIKSHLSRQKSFEIIIFDSKSSGIIFKANSKKSLTNSTDSKKDKNQNCFWLVERNVTPECDN